MHHALSLEHAVSKGRVTVRATADLIEEFLTPGEMRLPFRCAAGLPPGAKLIGAGWDWQQREVVMIFEHESFAAVPPAGEPPVLRPEFTYQQGQHEPGDADP